MTEQASPAKETHGSQAPPSGCSRSQRITTPANRSRISSGPKRTKFSMLYPSRTDICSTALLLMLTKQAGHLSDISRVRALVDQAHHDEEEAGYEPMRDHLQRGAGEPHLMEGGQTEQDVAHVTHAAVGNETFQIALPEDDKSAVDDVDR